MKTYRGLIGVLAAVGLLWRALPAHAEYSVVHSFWAAETDGQWPSSELVCQGGFLYGMTPYGGVSNCGSFFSVNTNNGALSILYRFSEETGRIPLGSLCFYNNRFYGMTSRGGSNDLGVIFSLLTNGTGYTIEHTFAEGDASNGSFPWGGFVEDGGLLYGMTYRGGANNGGTVMRFNPATKAYTNLHSFAGGSGDGKYPQGDLVLVSGRLYGITPQGGADGCGVVFGIDPDGTDFETLYEFTGQWDGSNPSGSLLSDGDLLYGMSRPGSGNAGTLWSVNRLASYFTLLRTFTGAADDGADPYGSLIKQGDSLYGMTRFGGVNSQGVIFRIGGSYTNLHHFANGGEPYGDLLVAGNQLYGMAFNEGANFAGSVFRMDLPADDDSVAYCAMTWIEEGAMGTTLLGDQNHRLAYVAHSNAVPDEAYLGYGRTPNADDDTWTWRAMGPYSPAGSYMEFTGTLGQATATGTYYVAAKFIKGLHVYYTKASFNDWGDWNTALTAGQTWTVSSLPAPSSVAGSYAASSNTVMLSCTGDGTHWVNVFRKSGTAPEMIAPINGTPYSSGTDYADQGRCVYAGPSGSFIDTNVVSNTTYRYVFYTENWNYYSAGTTKDVLTDDYDPAGDDNGDGIPNWWEVQYFGSATGVVAGVDSDGDGALDRAEYFAATDPTDADDVLRLDDPAFSAGGTPVFGANLLANEGYESGATAWTLMGNSAVNGWSPRTGTQGAILTGSWMGNNYATVLQKVSATAGTGYRAGGWFKREAVWNYSTVLKLEFLNSSDAVLAVQTSVLTTATADTWVNAALSGTAPAQTAYAQVVVEGTDISGNNGTFYLDDMAIQSATYSQSVNITWTIKPGRVYRVDYKTALTEASWLPVRTNITSVIEQIYTLSDTNSNGDVRRVYRIGVKLP